MMDKRQVRKELETLHNIANSWNGTVNSIEVAKWTNKVLPLLKQI